MKLLDLTRMHTEGSSSIHGDGEDCNNLAACILLLLEKIEEVAKNDSSSRRIFLGLQEAFGA